MDMRQRLFTQGGCIYAHIRTTRSNDTSMFLVVEAPISVKCWTPSGTEAKTYFWWYDTN